MLWPELAYDNEVFLPDGSQRPTPDSVCFNKDLFLHYRKLIRIRQSCPALRIGRYRTIQADDAQKLFIFERSCDVQRITVIINRSDKTHDLDLALTPCHDVLNPDRPPPAPGQTVTVPALWARILVRD
jgi:glycosidase